MRYAYSIFSILFYITILCGVVKSALDSKDMIFEDLDLVKKKSNEESSSVLRNLKLQNDIVKNIIREKRESQPGLKSLPLLLKDVKDQDEDITNEIFQKKRNTEELSSPFYIIKSPEQFGDGARLRLDFMCPGGNGSCPNFQSSAEVVEGQWQLPPEVPEVIIGPGENLREDIEPQFITENDLREELPTTTTTMTRTKTKTTRKKPGFFKGIENFFKHSFNMDKTTSPVNSSTTKKPSGYSPEVTQSSFVQSLPFPICDDVKPKIQEEIGNSGKPSFFETIQSFRGHDATFNLRIKAVAIPRLPEYLGTGS